MAITRDGLIRFVSDEYGPYIYVTEGPTGHVIGAVAPPNAILPVSRVESVSRRSKLLHELLVSL